MGDLELYVASGDSHRREGFNLDVILIVLINQPAPCVLEQEPFTRSTLHRVRAVRSGAANGRSI